MRKIFLSLSIALLTAASALAQSVLITTNTNGLNAVPYSILQLDPANIASWSNAPILNATGGVIRATGRYILHLNGISANAATALWWINAATGTVNTALNWSGHSAADFATAAQGGKADSLSATWTNYSPASFITPPGDANCYVWQNGWTQFSISGVAYREDNVSEFANDAGYLVSVGAANLNTTNTPQVNTVLTYTAAGMAWLAATTNQPPPSTITVGFTAAPTNGYASLVVTFTNTSVATGCNITNAVWDFGAGNSTTDLSVSVTHSYPLYGTNTVTLSEWTDTGLIANLVLTNLIVVSEVPTNRYALYFANSSVVTTPTIPLTGAWTIECWSSRQGDCSHAIGFVITSTDYTLLFGASTQFSGQDYLTYIVGTSGDFPYGTVPVYALNETNHVALCYDGAGTVTVWVNGTNVDTFAATPPTSEAFFIGSDGAGQGFNGIIDEVRISDIQEYTTTFTPQHCLGSDGHQLLYYKFDDGAGTIAIDSSGNGNDGTLSDSTLPVWTSQGVCYTPPSTPSYALEFDGSQNYVLTPYSAAFYPAQFTVECWLYVTDFPSYYAPIIETRNENTGGTGFSLALRNDGSIGFFADGVLGNWIATPSSVPLNVWNHIAVTYDGTNVVLWLNGVVQSFSGSSGSLVDGGLPFVVGTSADFVGDFGGLIDEVRFSNVSEYSDTFIPTHCLGTDGSTILYYKFDAGTGTTAIDSSGNGNDGTLEGSPTPTYVTPGICP